LGGSATPGLSHVAVVALHSAIDVKCVRHPRELRRTAVLVPARQADGIDSRSAIDVKCARHTDCPGELRGTDVPVPARKADGVASNSAIDVKCACHADCPGELRRTTIPSLLDRPTTLLAARPLMSSAPAAPTIPESSGAQTFLSLFERPAVFQPLSPRCWTHSCSTARQLLSSSTTQTG
jgi:hypothetical protein